MTACSTPAQLMDALAKRKAGLSMSYATIDRIVGLSDGRAERVLNGRGGLSVNLLFPMLEALGIELQLVERPDLAAKIMARPDYEADHWKPKRRLVDETKITPRAIKRTMAALGKKGAAKLNGMRDAAHRSESARHAAIVRWSSYKFRFKVRKPK